MTGTRKTAPLLALALVLAGTAAAADGVTIVETSLEHFDAEKYEGSQYRQALSHAHAARNDAQAKWAALQPALAFCDDKQDSATRTWVAVSTTAEHDELVAARGADAGKLAFVDIACPRAYVMAAYFAIDDGDTPRAIALLERAKQLAPFSSEAHAERGFVHNAAGERQLALASYRRALELIDRYPSNAGDRPIVLRGLGWTLIELGDYSGAREAYATSLELEPDHAGAKQELAYIERLIAERAPPPATPVFPTAKETAPGTLVPSPEKQRIVDNIRFLESRPFHPLAAQMRSDLIAWITEAPDVTVTLCYRLGLPSEDKGPYDSLIFVQSMFGIAAYLIQNPADDEVYAPQRAGVVSALKAYAAVLREHPEAASPSLDELLRHQKAGDLDDFLQPIIERECGDAADGPRQTADA